MSEEQAVASELHVTESDEALEHSDDDLDCEDPENGEAAMASLLNPNVPVVSGSARGDRRAERRDRRKKRRERRHHWREEE